MVMFPQDNRHVSSFPRKPESVALDPGSNHHHHHQKFAFPFAISISMQYSTLNLLFVVFESIDLICYNFLYVQCACAFFYIQIQIHIIQMFSLSASLLLPSKYLNHTFGYPSVLLFINFFCYHFDNLHYFFLLICFPLLFPLFVVAHFPQGYHLLGMFVLSSYILM